LSQSTSFLFIFIVLAVPIYLGFGLVAPYIPGALPSYGIDPGDIVVPPTETGTPEETYHGIPIYDGTYSYQGGIHVAHYFYYQGIKYVNGLVSDCEAKIDGLEIPLTPGWDPMMFTLVVDLGLSLIITNMEDRW